MSADKNPTYLSSFLSFTERLWFSEFTKFRKKTKTITKFTSWCIRAPFPCTKFIIFLFLYHVAAINHRWMLENNWRRKIFMLEIFLAAHYKEPGSVRWETGWTRFLLQEFFERIFVDSWNFWSFVVAWYETINMCKQIELQIMNFCRAFASKLCAIDWIKFENQALKLCWGWSRYMKNMLCELSNRLDLKELEKIVFYSDSFLKKNYKLKMKHRNMKINRRSSWSMHLQYAQKLHLPFKSS